MPTNYPRIAIIVLGVWLFISAFLWPHTSAQMTNTWIVGIVCAVAAAVAVRIPDARYVDTVLAVWLFISVWALPRSAPGTAWNNALCAIAIFVLSLAPAMPAGLGPRRSRATGGGVGPS
jgi:SPW repeat-containing protein